MTEEEKKKIIKFIEELAWRDVQYDAFLSTMYGSNASRSGVSNYAKIYFDLWKEMFNEDLQEKGGAK